MVAAVPSVLGPLPTHTALRRPHTPGRGLSLGLDSQMDEQADRESNWDDGTPSSSPLSASNSASVISGLSGFGTGNMITISTVNLTLTPLSAGMPDYGELEVCTSMIEDDTFQLPLPGASGTSDDVYGVDNYPSTPILSTIPLPPEPTMHGTLAGGAARLPPTAPPRRRAR